MKPNVHFLLTIWSCIWMLSTPAMSSPGLIGIGKGMYHPSCAHGCRGAISSAPLSCSVVVHEGGGGGMMGHGNTAETSPACRANDTAFLTTLAWCMNTACEPLSASAWLLEKFWVEKTTGKPGLVPKWTYGETLHRVVGDKQPERELDLEHGEALNFTAVVPREAWEVEMRSLEYFEHQESTQSRYGVILLVVGAGIPVVTTLLTYLPYMTGVLDKIKPILIYPSTFGTYHVRSLPYLLGNPPTIGQAGYIFIFFALNVVLTAVNYPTTQPNTMFTTPYREIVGYISLRTGVISFALAPLVILFAGRNNFLLWITNWSHSTYILLHRWVARIFSVQVIVHSIAELVFYIDKGTYEEELVKEYWIWGIVATVACCAMLISSVLYFRKASYEIFITLHILLAVFVLVGSWYHVELLFSRRWGYELWLYAAFAVWVFDWALRAARIAKTGVCRAKVTELDDEYVRVDIPGVKWSSLGLHGYHAYVHFPTLSVWRPWENHPFSIVPTAFFNAGRDYSGLGIGATDSSSRSSSSDDIAVVSKDIDIEKEVNVSPSANTLVSPTSVHRKTRRVISTRTATTTSASPATGVTFYIRKEKGLTKYLKNQQNLLTLLDGPYTCGTKNSILSCDRLLLLGGGVGITALLPYIHSHPNVKLFWSVRQSAKGLVDDLQGTIENAGVENDIRVGQRLDIDLLLEEEANIGWKKMGVIVCGPGGLCDDARAMVIRVGRAKDCTFELEVHAFSW